MGSALTRFGLYVKEMLIQLSLNPKIFSLDKSLRICYNDLYTKSFNNKLRGAEIQNRSPLTTSDKEGYYIYVRNRRIYGAAAGSAHTA